MKILIRIIYTFFFLIILFVSYLSIVGVETERFNDQISKKIQNIDKKLEIELKKIKLVLDPFKLKLNIKTVGSKLKIQKNSIEIENIKTQISLKSLIENKFSIENLEISTKSLEIKNLISFLRSIQNTPQLYILEKTLKRGFLIADIKLEFYANGKIKDNYEINGFIKDTKLSVFKKYNFEKLNLIFKYKKNNLSLSDIKFSLNNLNFLSEKISLRKIKGDYFISGNINNKKLDIDEQNLNLFIKPLLSDVEFKKLSLSSNNNFSFKVSKKFKVENFVIDSKVLVDQFTIDDNFNLKKFFPKIKKNINFSNHDLSIKYFENVLYIDGTGDVLFQDKKDILTYSIVRKKNNLDFKTSLKIEDNPLRLNFLNYEKYKTIIKLNGSKNKKNEMNIELFSIDEKKNKIIAKNITFNKEFEIIKIGTILLDYFDKENKKNKIKIYPRKNKFILDGSFFNANNFIDNLINDKESSFFFNIDTQIEINIDEIILDDENNLSNFKGNILLKNKEIIKANLNGNFSDSKKLKFTINTNGQSKVTTLYVDNAKPIVGRYKFIKGFEGGILDFYSTKKNDLSKSTIKIYNFRLKELPALTKILTLASLQGIADILTGEGIRFDEFEMNFQNQKNLMTINEIYAIGPAISFLMEGYIEKDKLISLRGTLVPATTINKAIGSIPVLGKILVGSKTGEGVFGVSFKIKGPQENLETSVNPIKTLTPRFITRTLEKIKKN